MNLQNISNQQKIKSLKETYAKGEKKSRHSMEEFGPGKQEFIFCPQGEAVYFKKSWHHTEEFLGRTLNPKKEKGIKFKLCPAHQMLKNKQYEGEIVVKNIPAERKKDLFSLVKNMGETAMRLDVLDRILGFKTKGQTLQVITSENQLAQKIARKITKVFKQETKAKISRGKESDVVRVIVEFLNNI